MHKDAVVVDASAKDNRWLMRERDKSKNVGTNKVQVKHRAYLHRLQENLSNQYCHDFEDYEKKSVPRKRVNEKKGVNFVLDLQPSHKANKVEERSYV